MVCSFISPHRVIGEEGVADAGGQRVPAVLVLPRALLHEHRVDHAHSVAVLEKKENTMKGHPIQHKVTTV